MAPQFQRAHLGEMHCDLYREATGCALLAVSQHCADGRKHGDLLVAHRHVVPQAVSQARAGAQKLKGRWLVREHLEREFLQLRFETFLGPAGNQAHGVSLRFPGGTLGRLHFDEEGAGAPCAHANAFAQTHQTVVGSANGNSQFRVRAGQFPGFPVRAGLFPEPRSHDVENPVSDRARSEGSSVEEHVVGGKGCSGRFHFA